MSDFRPPTIPGLPPASEIAADIIVDNNPKVISGTSDPIDSDGRKSRHFNSR